jgi:hypothetical protein
MKGNSRFLLKHPKPSIAKTIRDRKLRALAKIARAKPLAKKA